MTAVPDARATEIKSSPRQQRTKRYRVHLAIRYRDNGKLIDAFAENVSRGGLFITGAQRLAPGSIVKVEIPMPGAAEYTVRAEVRHILPEEMARRFKRKPGAGVMFQETPAGFDAVLAAYLFRLARREEVAVLVTDDSSEQLLKAAGYLTQRAPKADEVNDAVSASLQPIIGVVVRTAETSAYRDALAKQDAEELVVELENVNELDETLALLDKRLSEEAPLDAATVDPSLGEMEDLPGPSASPGKPASAPREAGPASTSSGSHPRPGPSAPPRPRGASYTFVAILVLLTGGIGFAVAFLMYFDRNPTGYARRSNRGNCIKCKPCPPPAAASPRIKPPMKRVMSPAP